MDKNQRGNRENPSCSGCSAVQPHNSKQKAAKCEVISKYFPSTLKSVDSPFRGALSRIECNITPDDVGDFKTPESLNKCPKPFQQTKTKTVTRKLRQKKISSLLKSVEENFSHENVNSEHLQMALALSKSISECVEDSSETEAEVYNAVYLCSSEKVINVKGTLEEFGFKSEGGRRVPSAHGKANNDTNKKRKKSKFQYVTPVLFIRKEEERRKIIENKISLILSENLVERAESNADANEGNILEISSTYLEKLLSKDDTVFKLNTLERNELCVEKLYVKCLNLSPSQAKCGSLLKKWSLIPGRETTPPRDIKCEGLNEAENECKEPEVVITKNEGLEKPTEKYRRLEKRIKSRSISPDLFESDNESIIERGENKESELLSAQTTDKEDGGQDCIDFVGENESFLFTQTDLQDSSGSAQLFSENQQEKNISSNNHVHQMSAENGILHYESFYKESEVLSQEYVDLTQSSDDEGAQAALDIISATNDHGNGIAGIQRQQLENEGKNTPQHNCTFIVASEETFNGESMNVTDYIYRILSQDGSEDVCASDDEVSSFTRNNSADKNQRNRKTTCLKHSTCTCNCSSYESVCISNEELNYSIVEPAVEREIDDWDKGDWEEEDEHAVTEQMQDLSSASAKVESKRNITEHSSFTSSGGKRATTPKTSFIVRTTNVTPMPDFDGMKSPEVVRELGTFGVKAMKRKRGVELLKHIYNATHPFADSQRQQEDPEEQENLKKRRINANDPIGIVGDALMQNELRENLIFERTQSKRIHSCRMPLQIAFHNLLCCNTEIQEKILLYEPVQLEELHMMLKNQGFKYHIKDLLTFLDRKCITVRIHKTTTKNYP